MGSLKYGVSVYSYVNDYASVMTLEDAFDHIADTGATVIVTANALRLLRFDAGRTG